MSETYHIGQRASFELALCTIRYIGPVKGTSKTWLGVEWDDATRGKHNGEHNGRRYFNCKSTSLTAASFIRPTRFGDPEQSFVEAVHQKYARETSRSFAYVPDQEITISGKVVENVGFDKIRAQLAQLHQLKIVIVDGFGITHAELPDKSVREVCPKVQELDLSRNLFESFSEVSKICGQLEHLRSLRLNGTRLNIVPGESLPDLAAYGGILELELDDSGLAWEEIHQVIASFKSLKSLSISSCGYLSLNTPLINSLLTSITLEYNQFTTLSQLSGLSRLESLERLLLKGNQIEGVSATGSGTEVIFNSKLQYIDLSYNNISSWSVVDELANTFPGMTALRLSHNPIYGSMTETAGPGSLSLDNIYMLVVAKLKTLNTLNYSSITAADRTNAEMYYLSQIGLAMAEVTKGEEGSVTAQHKRYNELCSIYGAPDVRRSKGLVVNPDFLESRLIIFTFYMPNHNDQNAEGQTTKVQEIPKFFDVYRVKSIVGRLFGFSPLKLKLTWETGEWDPVEGYKEEELEDSDDEDDESELPKQMKLDPEKEEEKGKWIRREVQLEDSTRSVCFCVDGMEATIRVELR